MLYHTGLVLVKTIGFAQRQHPSDPASRMIITLKMASKRRLLRRRDTITVFAVDGISMSHLFAIIFLDGVLFDTLSNEHL